MRLGHGGGGPGGPGGGGYSPVARGPFVNRCFARRTAVSNAPDRARRIICNQQRTILGLGDGRRPSPYLGTLATGHPEAGCEVLVGTVRPVILERHAHHLVPGRLGAVP